MEGCNMFNLAIIERWHVCYRMNRNISLCNDIRKLLNEDGLRLRSTDGKHDQ